MFGTLRVILAAMVALSHVDVTLFGKNIGVVAVVMFYIISGYVMTGLIRTHYAQRASLWYFYTDRAIRIYPQYLLFLVIGFILVVHVGVEADTFDGDFGFSDIVKNLLIVPMNFYMFEEDMRGLALIPPSWSLGAELQFYALIPFILWYEWRPPAILFSLIIFSSSLLVDTISTNYYGYRLLPGILHIFLCGSLLYDYVQGKKHLGKYLALLYGFGVLSFAFAVFSDRAHMNHVTEVFFGFALGLPLVFLLALVGRRKADDFIGNFSYGMFLGHFAVIWIAGHSGIFDPGDRPAFFLLLTALAGFLGFILVEKPVLSFRRNIRSSRSKKT